MRFHPLIQIQAVTSLDSSGYTVHKKSQAENIIFDVYTNISGSPFLPTDKMGNCCDFLIIIIIIIIMTINFKIISLITIRILYIYF